jgi:6-phosphogluconolactonase
MKMGNSIRCSVFEDIDWSLKSAQIIAENIKVYCSSRGVCNLMLTGGKSAAHLYQDLFPIIREFSGQINFYFGDERCVKMESLDSNYQMVLGCLPNSFDMSHIIRIKGEAEDLQEECDRYASILPDNMDILLLSIGDDAHIASIFPHFDAHIHEKMVAATESPNHPHKRISITKKVIDKSSQIFCLVKGEKKGIALSAAFMPDADWHEYPARLAESAHWLLDRSANENFIHNKV